MSWRRKAGDASGQSRKRVPAHRLMRHMGVAAITPVTPRNVAPARRVALRALPAP